MPLEVGLLCKMSYSEGAARRFHMSQNIGKRLYLYLCDKTSVLCCRMVSFQCVVTAVCLNLNVKRGGVGHTLTFSVFCTLAADPSTLPQRLLGLQPGARGTAKQIRAY